MSTIYGYCRISTQKQNIARQERNIKEQYPTAHISKEAFTGRKLDRPEWNKIYDRVKPGDTIVFDSVSRMSRDAKGGFELYKDLYAKNVNLVFLKEHHIDTDAYKDAMKGLISSSIDTGDEATTELVDGIMKAVNKFMMRKVEADIFKAFEQSQKEVDDLSQRTKEGLVTARLNGKRIGRKKGAIITVAKKEPAKKAILKYSKDFNGSLNDVECMSLIKLSRNTYYKYKKELKQISNA